MIGVLGTITYSVRVDKPELSKYAGVLILLRCYVALFDIEERRRNSSEVYNSIFFVAALNGLGI